jgi:hypothetical protein
MEGGWIPNSLSAKPSMRRSQRIMTMAERMPVSCPFSRPNWSATPMTALCTVNGPMSTILLQNLKELNMASYVDSSIWAMLTTADTSDSIPANALRLLAC